MALGLGQLGPSRTCDRACVTLSVCSDDFQSALTTTEDIPAALPTSPQPCAVDSAVLQLCPCLPHPLNIHIFVRLEGKRKAER